MNKRPLLIIVVILAAVIGGGAYLALSKDGAKAKDDMMKISKVSTSTPPSDTKTTPTTQEPTKAGAYIPYNDTVIASTTGTKLLFFHAPWCPQCREIETDINEQGVPAGVTVIKVDYDSNQSLRKKYGVTLQTTFVKVDDSGNLVQKFVAYDEPTFDSVKANIL